MGGGASTPPRLEGVGTERESEGEDESEIVCEGDTSRVLAARKGFLETVPNTAEREANDDEVDLDDVITTTAADIPEEVWLSIFRTLDHSDMLSCYRAIPEWKSWLSYKRTSLLFREVTPLLLQGLQVKDMLNCRIACSAWKRGFDDAFQSHPQHLTFEPFDDPSQKTKRIREFTPAMWSAEGIQEFLRDVEGHPDNPFPGRSIELVCTDSPQDLPVNFNGNLYRENARQLMDTFGHHLYFADLYFTHLVDFGITVEQVLQDLLLRLPNLKRLHVARQDFDGGFRMEGDPAVFGDNPLPRLLHLESLSVMSYTGGHYDMISEMLTACCVPQNIKRLLLHCPDNIYRYYEQIYSFKNLEVLKLSISVEDLEGFGNLEQLPPLREMVFYVCNRDPSSYEEVDFQRVFTAIELFSSSLEDVLVYGCGYGFSGALRMIDPSSNYTVKLPKLKRLRLENYDGPLEPLFQLSSLIHLKIKFIGLWAGAGRADVVYGIENRLYRNNIWNVFPCLKTLVISRAYRVGNTYTKKIYDRQSFECEMYDWQSCSNVKERRQNIM